MDRESVRDILLAALCALACTAVLGVLAMMVQP
jgi:hypothetical protein